MIRKATEQDICFVEENYRDLLVYEAEYGSHSNWVLDVYPTRATAEKACREGSLYILQEGNEICASVILNQTQASEYEKIEWAYPAEAGRVFVIHTLCVPPSHKGKGYGKQMVRFAIQKAVECGCEVIRLDTWAGNKPVAAFYKKLGFQYAGAADILLQGLIAEEQVFFEMRLDKVYRRRDMRRKDREMPEAFAWEIADKCEWAVLGMTDPSGDPYCVPISIVRENTCVYFHSAQSGFKTDCLKNNGSVCISCVGDTFRLPDAFTTEYESAVLRGKAVEVTEENEKVRALRLLCERHTPTNMENFDEAVSKSLFRTAIWRVDVQEITGKRKKYDAEGKEMKFGRME